MRHRHPALVACALALALIAGPARPTRAADGPAPAPVRMGAGVMTFDTVPGWGLGPDGKSQLGSTHGGVAVDQAGNIYTSAHAGLFVFAPDGKLVRSYRGDAYADMHDIKIRPEGDGEFLYGARNNNAEGVKLDARTGAIVLHLPFPAESGLKLAKFMPTAIAVAPDGAIFLADGYASNHVFKFDKAGKYLMHFGTKGNGLQEFNTCHGMALDPRYDPPRLLICDRNHEPRGRLVHYDLDGHFLGEVVTGLNQPTSVAIQGDHVAVPDLQGRLAILDKSNTIVAVLGTNADPAKRGNFNVPQAGWVEGIFSGTHGSAWDRDGNLYVQDWNVAGRIMKLVRDGPPGTARPDQATLRPGDSGAAVEGLQRALNAQLAPAAPLDVDGDYGEGTRGAVGRFQRLRGLAPTGLADAATREALGPPPPPAAEPAVAEPAVVNAEVNLRQPAEGLDAPPAVLAPTWAIADGKTGAVLWGANADRPVEIASTTKIMTALVVARFAAGDPRVLDEVVTFSERADRTPGSTSGLKAGERVPAGELLYGLLLPSGNDAATAFAEHFGGRCPAPSSSSSATRGAEAEADPLARFVAEMNRVAGDLGLAETHFDNPHGLPSPAHRASARDLARLASVALRDPTLARVVNTPKRGCAATTAAGATRNLIWGNTNRLLATAGYDGVKTGTTNGAGNCLVASARRGDDHLILVILGAPTSDARYADARNLFRYGWTRRAAGPAPAPAAP